MHIKDIIQKVGSDIFTTYHDETKTTPGAGNLTKTRLFVGFLVVMNMKKKQRNILQQQRYGLPYSSSQPSRSLAHMHVERDI